MPGRTDRATAWTALLVAAAAAVATAMATRAGPAITPDSISYLRMAKGLPLLEHPPGHFPNGYPAVLSILRALGLSPLDAARWLGVLLAATNVVLAAAYARRMAGNRWAVGVATAVAAATPLAVLDSSLLSEPLFLALMLGWLLCVGSENRSVSAAAGALATAAFLTRYAGAALILAGAVTLWPQRRRLLSFAAGASAPLAVWGAVRAASGSVTSRVAAWHPPDSDVVRGGIDSLATWVTGNRGTLLSGTIVLAGAVLLLVRVRRLPGGRDLGIAAACYLVVLAITIAVFDAQTPLDTRLLAPVQLIVILACPAIGTLPMRRALAAVLGVIVALTAIATARDLSDIRAREPLLAGSPTIAAARHLDGRIASNAPGALWLRTGLEATWIPQRTDPHTLEQNAALADEMHEIARALGDDGHVIWLDLYDYRTYLPTEQELVRSLHLVLVEQLPDGAIYRTAS